MYPLVTKGMGATARPVPLDDALVHDLPAMADAIGDATRLVMLCNPNNPTGTSVRAGAFDAFMERVPDDVVVCIDEAYYEYVRSDDFPDAIAWTRRRPGTLVLRTFSKIYGLAGMRVGYGVADEELAGYLHRARHPFNVNRLAEIAAVAALEDPRARRASEAHQRRGGALSRVGARGARHRDVADRTRTSCSRAPGRTPTTRCSERA